MKQQNLVALLAILPMAFKCCTNNAEAVSPTADTPADATLPIVYKAADDISPMASVTSSTADCPACEGALLALCICCRTLCGVSSSFCTSLLN